MTRVSLDGIPVLLFLAAFLTAWQILVSFLFLLFRFEFPTGKNSNQPISFVLEDDSQFSAPISPSIQHVDIIEATLISSKTVVMEKAFFGLMRFNTMVAQMLDIPILLVFRIPFKLVPARFRHQLFPALGLTL